MVEADWEQPGEDAGQTVGERVRSLRRSAGLSQEALAAGRFSKEYVSQIERGKTRPTPETLEWLAARLATDRDFLEHGFSRAAAEQSEAAVRNAEQLVETRRDDEAVAAYRDARAHAGAALTPRLALRLLRGEAWALVRTGDLDAAMSALEEAAAVAVGPGFTDVDRAEVVFLVGVVRYSQSSIREAVGLFDQALVLADGSSPDRDRLRSDIFHWLSRCHRRNRDWVAAAEDIERALELAEASNDTRRVADALFQASLVAQRQGRWVRARTDAERSRALFEELGDRATAARLLNNLAGLDHLLGDQSGATVRLERAFEIFVDEDLPVDAGYVCASLAEIRLACDEPKPAEAQARKALELLGDRIDHLQEVGTAQLALGRALAAQGRLDDAEASIAAAEATFERARSAGHRSYAWVARGDLQSQRGNDREAADLYRRAARALQDADV